MQNRKTALLAFCLLGLWVSAMYWSGLYGDFFFDDSASILLPPGIKLDVLTWDALRQAWLSGGAGPSGRPIAQLSFALNYYFSGFSPFAYKASNLAIHGVCGLLVFGLAQRLLNVAYPHIERQRTQWVALAVSALWLAHPIQLLAVLHVVQRMTSLSALFMLAAIWLHIASRERGDRVGVVGLVVAWGIVWPLSFLSKEAGALFPVFVLAWEAILRRPAVGRLDPFARRFFALCGLAALGLAAYLLSDKAQWLWAGYELRTFGMEERLLTEGRVLWFYLGLVLLPRLSAFGLYHDDVVLSTGWLSPWTTFPAILGLLGLLGLAWRMRSRAPLVAFGIAWFFIGHSMESTVLPLEIAHEHRNYIPVFGLLIAGAGGFMELTKRAQKMPPFGATFGVVLFISISVITALRAHQFGDEVRRTQSAAVYHSTSAQAQYEAGSTLAGLEELTTPQSPLYAIAREHFALSLSLNPAFKMGGLGLIHLRCKTGQVPDPADVTELARRLRATPFGPSDQNVLFNIKEMTNEGTLCLGRTEMDNLFAAAVGNPTVSPHVRAILFSWYADYLWLHERDMTAARSALSQSLTLNPSNASNRLKWAQLLFIAGETAATRSSLLGLDAANLSGEERKTLEELHGAINMPTY